MAIAAPAPFATTKVAMAIAARIRGRTGSCAEIVTAKILTVNPRHAIRTTNHKAETSAVASATREITDFQRSDISRTREAAAPWRLHLTPRRYTIARVSTIVGRVDHGANGRP